MNTNEENFLAIVALINAHAEKVSVLTKITEGTQPICILVQGRDDHVSLDASHSAAFRAGIELALMSLSELPIDSGPKKEVH